MWVLILAIIALGAIVGVAELFMRRRGAEPAVAVQPEATCSTCTGSNDKCEQECMMEAATKEIEYYDDEELDAFRGRPSADYTDEEAEQFGYILSTMREEEVAGWCRSLNLRGIELPNQIKDEVVMIVSDGHS
jgi:hypothetical protein